MQKRTLLLTTLIFTALALSATDTVEHECDVGSVEYFRTLLENKEKIHFSGSIDSAEATALAKVLEENRTLRVLRMPMNQICDDGALAIASMLHKNNTLTEIDMRYSGIRSAGRKALAEALKFNKTIITLYYFNSPIGRDVPYEIADDLARNREIASNRKRKMRTGSEKAILLAAAFYDENTNMAMLNEEPSLKNYILFFYIELL